MGDPMGARPKESNRVAAPSRDLIPTLDVDSGDTPGVDPGDATRRYPLDFGDTYK
jgi:hypothetical protein